MPSPQLGAGNRAAAGARSQSPPFDARCGRRRPHAGLPHAATADAHGAAHAAVGWGDLIGAAGFAGIGSRTRVLRAPGPAALER